VADAPSASDLLAAVCRQRVLAVARQF